MPELHPSPAQLALRASERAPAWLDAHLARCDRCRAVAPEEQDQLPDVRLTQPGRPSHVINVLNEVVPATVNPRPDQVWRAEWDGAVSIVAIVRLDGDAVLAHAVEMAPPSGAQGALLVERGLTPLECAFAIELNEPVELPAFLLDRWLADLPTSISVAGLHASAGLDMGAATRRLHRLVEVMNQALEAPDEDNILAMRLREAGIERRDLVDAGLQRARASLLLQGRSAPTSEEAEAIAPLLGVDPGLVTEAAGSIAGELLAELHRPHRRPVLRQRSLAQGRPEPIARRVAAREIESVRNRSSPGSTIDWAAAVDEYFAHDDA